MAYFPRVIRSVSIGRDGDQLRYFRSTDPTWITSSSLN